MTKPASSPDREHPAAAYHARRRGEVDAKILKTARDILDSEGLSALTVERVAAESGVAKTTIYRRFKHRLDLATAAVAELPTQPEKNPAGATDLKDWIRRVIEAFDTSMRTRGAEVIGAGLMYRHDEEFFELFQQRLIVGRGQAARPRLEAAVESGEIRGDTDVATMYNLITGSVIAAHLGGSADDPKWIDQAVELVWTAIQPQG